MRSIPFLLFATCISCAHASFSIAFYFDDQCTNVSFETSVPENVCVDGSSTCLDTFSVNYSCSENLATFYNSSDCTNPLTSGPTNGTCIELPFCQDSNGSVAFTGNFECPRCGDGNVDPGEECDDGNDIAGDGCEQCMKTGTCSLNSSVACANNAHCDFSPCGGGVCDFPDSNPLPCDSKSDCDGICAPDGNGIEVCMGGSNDSTECESTADCQQAQCAGTTCQGATDVQCTFDEFCIGVCQICGNGMIEPGEQCDNGADNNDNADCTTNCTLSVCGDGYLNKFGPNRLEECDDGNDVADDGCDQCMQTGTCSLNSSVICSNDTGCDLGPCAGTCDDDTPLACTNDTTCSGLCVMNGCIGGALDGEPCDSTIDCQVGCERFCTGASFVGCTVDADCLSMCNPTPTCGNGILEAGEECDDGNPLPDDGCFECVQECACNAAPQFECNQDGSGCAGVCENITGTCGDIMCATNVECMGNCSGNCEIMGMPCASDNDCPGQDESCVGTCVGGAFPGNQCVGDSTCQDSCLIEGACSNDGSVCGMDSDCDLGPCACTPTCGNAIIEAGEQCDDGNVLPGDGCDMMCQLEPMSR